jgi:hypothetical protein
MLRLSVPIALRQRRTGFYLLLGLLAVVLAFGAYRYWHKAPRYKGGVAPAGRPPATRDAVGHA